MPVPPATCLPHVRAQVPEYMPVVRIGQRSGGRCGSQALPDVRIAYPQVPVPPGASSAAERTPAHGRPGWTGRGSRSQLLRHVGRHLSKVRAQGADRYLERPGSGSPIAAVQLQGSSSVLPPHLTHEPDQLSAAIVGGPPGSCQAGHANAIQLPDEFRVFPCHGRGRVWGLWLRR